jgi:hypothetical protein
MDLLRMFVAGATARATSETVGVHHSTATSFSCTFVVSLRASFPVASCFYLILFHFEQVTSICLIHVLLAL